MNIAYAGTIHRAVKKPFNPLLGETYENIRDDKGFRFISEKVSHHPPIMACFAESDDFTFFQDNNIKTKYWVNFNYYYYYYYYFIFYFIFIYFFLNIYNRIIKIFS